MVAKQDCAGAGDIVNVIPELVGWSSCLGIKAKDSSSQILGIELIEDNIGHQTAARSPYCFHEVTPKALWLSIIHQFDGKTFLYAGH